MDKLLLFLLTRGTLVLLNTGSFFLQVKESKFAVEVFLEFKFISYIVQANNDLIISRRGGIILIGLVFDFCCRETALLLKFYRGA